MTIYAEGNGQTLITIYLKGTGLFGSDLGAEVVDEYYVPSVNMIYTELDNLDAYKNKYLDDDMSAYEW